MSLSACDGRDDDGSAQSSYTEWMFSWQLLSKMIKITYISEPKLIWDLLWEVIYLFILKAVVVWHFGRNYDYYNKNFMNECATTGQ